MKYFQKIRTIVFSTELPLWKYCFLTFWIFISVSVIANIFIKTLAVFLTINYGPEEIKTNLSVIESVVVSIIVPFIETLLLAVFLILFKIILKNNMFIAIIIAIVAGLTHSKQDWTHFFIYAAMFYLFALFYLTRSKISFANGFIAAFVPHLLNNSMIALFAYYDI